MTLNSKRAKVFVKVPCPDQMVHVRVYPPDSLMEVKISPEGLALEIKVFPRGRTVEVQVTPAPDDEEDLAGGPSGGGSPPGSGDPGTDGGPEPAGGGSGDGPDAGSDGGPEGSPAAGTGAGGSGGKPGSPPPGGQVPGAPDSTFTAVAASQIDQDIDLSGLDAGETSFREAASFREAFATSLGGDDTDPGAGPPPPSPSSTSFAAEAGRGEDSSFPLAEAPLADEPPTPEELREELRSLPPRLIDVAQTADDVSDFQQVPEGGAADFGSGSGDGGEEPYDEDLPFAEDAPGGDASPADGAPAGREPLPGADPDGPAFGGVLDPASRDFIENAPAPPVGLSPVTEIAAELGAGPLSSPAEEGSGEPPEPVPPAEEALGPGLDTDARSFIEDAPAPPLERSPVAEISSELQGAGSPSPAPDGPEDSVPAADGIFGNGLDTEARSYIEDAPAPPVEKLPVTEVISELAPPPSVPAGEPPAAPEAEVPAVPGTDVRPSSEAASEAEVPAVPGNDVRHSPEAASEAEVPAVPAEESPAVTEAEVREILKAASPPSEPASDVPVGTGVPPSSGAREADGTEIGSPAASGTDHGPDPEAEAQARVLSRLLVDSRHGAEEPGGAVDDGKAGANFADFLVGGEQGSTPVVEIDETPGPVDIPGVDMAAGGPWGPAGPAVSEAMAVLAPTREPEAAPDPGARPPRKTVISLDDYADDPSDSRTPSGPRLLAGPALAEISAHVSAFDPDLDIDPGEDEDAEPQPFTVESGSLAGAPVKHVRDASVPGPPAAPAAGALPLTGAFPVLEAESPPELVTAHPADLREDVPARAAGPLLEDLDLDDPPPAAAPGPLEDLDDEPAPPPERRDDPSGSLLSLDGDGVQDSGVARHSSPALTAPEDPGLTAPSDGGGGEPFREAAEPSPEPEDPPEDTPAPAEHPAAASPATPEPAPPASSPDPGESEPSPGLSASASGREDGSGGASAEVSFGTGGIAPAASAAGGSAPAPEPFGPASVPEGPLGAPGDAVPGLASGAAADLDSEPDPDELGSGPEMSLGLAPVTAAIFPGGTEPEFGPAGDVAGADPELEAFVPVPEEAFGTSEAEPGAAPLELPGDLPEGALSEDLQEGGPSEDFQEGALSGDFQENVLSEARPEDVPSGDFPEDVPSGDLREDALSGDVAEDALSGDVAEGALSGDVAEGALSGDVAEDALSGDVAEDALSGGMLSEEVSGELPPEPLSAPAVSRFPAGPGMVPETFPGAGDEVSVQPAGEAAEGLAVRPLEVPPDFGGWVEADEHELSAGGFRSAGAGDDPEAVLREASSFSSSKLPPTGPSASLWADPARRIGHDASSGAEAGEAPAAAMSDYLESNTDYVGADTGYVEGAHQIPQQAPPFEMRPAGSTLETPYSAAASGGRSRPETSTAVIVNYLDDRDDGIFAEDTESGELGAEDDLDIDLLDVPPPAPFLAKPMVPVPRDPR